MKQHQYQVKVEWTGNQGNGTKNYKSYKRDYDISGVEKTATILGSSDPSFLGDKTRYNPEDLLVSSLSSCHMLWYLHLCAVNKIIVTEYVDNAKGIMSESKNGSGSFKEVTLHPTVTVTDESMVQKAAELHEEANKMCFIANSCNFEINHQAKILVSKV
ncbi:OsmC family protein [Xanthovirga aplysinae]|uniref:OsmC family protein n=1 Tax=Xanthovirga aplysinae TaxID=2529853 RepID=UPI0012BD21BE|nr:OsmC family protein [Xanthovirga aplysinae]MTI31696.1 OsmC family peroxiredoxin [Xanthovirga aplysinae]